MRMRPRVFGSVFLSAAAKAAWHVSRSASRAFPERHRPAPEWAPAPLPNGRDRSTLSMGIPRRTQSLCPRCNAEAVGAVLRGVANVTDFRTDPGVIDAQILEQAGRVVMRKTCARHGTFEDVLSTDPAFSKRLESLHFGHDFACTGHTSVHDHGPSTLRTGRGVALIVDLTNRCNLKCSPCFMTETRRAGAGSVYAEHRHVAEREVLRRSREVSSATVSQILTARGHLWWVALLSRVSDRNGVPL